MFVITCAMSGVPKETVSELFSEYHSIHEYIDLNHESYVLLCILAVFISLQIPEPDVDLI